MEITDPEKLKRMIEKFKYPLAIFFYMDGCPHCEKMMEPWDKLQLKREREMFIKVESKNIPKEFGISAFPHFELIKHGEKVKTVDGAMEIGELERRLFDGKSGGRRRRTRVRKTRRRTVRKSRK